MHSIPTAARSTGDASRVPLELRRRAGRHRAGAPAGRGADCSPTKCQPQARPAPVRLHHPAKAKRVVQLFMSGAASQCDTFDYKPELIKRNGQPFDPGEKVELFQSNPGRLHEEPLGLEAVRPVRQVDERPGAAPGHLRRRHGVHPLDGLEVERPRAGHVHAEHGLRAARLPGMGAWVSLRPGQPERQPADVRRAARLAGFAPNGPGNWSAGFLPAAHQGTLIRPAAANPIADLFPPPSAKYITPDSERDGLGAAGATEPRAPGRSRGRLAARRADRLVRAGRPAATERARGARHLRRDRRPRARCTAWTTR